MLQTAPSPVSLLRIKCIATAAVAVLTAGSLAALPAKAQTPAAGGGAMATKPATPMEVNIYNQMAAFNICALAANKVPLEKSLPASIEMVVTALNFVHGGIVQGANNGKKLDMNQLANGTAFSIVPRVKQMCFDKFSSDDQKKINDLMAQIQKALNSPPATGK
jgi:hypothetical protein